LIVVVARDATVEKLKAAGRARTKTRDYPMLETPALPAKFYWAIWATLTRSSSE